MNLEIKGYHIFDYIFILFMIITLISIAIRGSGRIRYGDAIHDKEARRADAAAQNNHKSDKKPKDILSMKFGDHTNVENSDEEESD